MSSYVEMIRAVSGKYNDKVKRLTSELFSHFNLNSFWYNKISDRGTIAALASHMHWTEYFGWEKMYAKYPFLRHSRSIQPGVRLLKDVDHAPLRDVLSSCKDKYDMSFLFSITNKTEDGIEEFGFASPYSSGPQISMMFNELPLLRLFAKKFKEENQFLLSKLEDNKIDLTALIGSAFYESSLPLTLSSENRRQLLQKLGMRDRTLLTVADTAVMDLLLQGYSASQIGERLFRSRRTIEHRIEKIKEKLSCQSKSELIQKYQEIESFDRLGK